MMCVFCGGKLEEKVVEEEIIEGRDRALVEIQAEVCLNCHEKYFSEGIVDKLIDLKENLKAHQLKLKEVGKVYQLG